MLFISLHAECAERNALRGIRRMSHFSVIEGLPLGRTTGAQTDCSVRPQTQYDFYIMELILPGLFLFFVAGPLLFVWLGYRAVLLAKRLAERQQTAEQINGFVG